MNANTALKINDAISQAVRCGESRSEILAQIHKAWMQAEREKAQDSQKELETFLSKVLEDR